jgi:DNA modification methylase
MAYDQLITEDYALYLGDCVEVMHALPKASADMVIYSPPFAGLYTYSSSERDLSNCRSYEEFFAHYTFCVQEIFQLLKPGCITAVHCADVPLDGANLGAGLRDFSGDIIRLHEKIGFAYCARYHVWKEPLGVRNRTMAKGLAHRQLVEDSSLCDVASADYLLMFRREGTRSAPVIHPQGLLTYAGERKIPHEVLEWKGFNGNQIQNRYSHWIWRQYASAFWDDVRIDRVLPYKIARDPEDERHIHPLQLDVIERAIVLWTNVGETVLTPFMGIGSEVYGAVINGRKGLGIELKPTYYRQAVKNIEHGLKQARQEQEPLSRYWETDVLK